MHGCFVAALALLVPGLRPRHRPLLLGLAAVPLALDALSGGARRPPRPRGRSARA